MRRLTITSITPSSSAGTPGTIEVGSNFTSIFHGKEWIDQNKNLFPYYTYDLDSSSGTPAPPAGTQLVVASTFQIVQNSKYNGSYTVYTKLSSSGIESSTYDSSTDRTTIRVNEAMPLLGSADPALLSTGFITNISTYLLVISGEPAQVVLEADDISTRPIELVGRFSSGWGEALQQNQLLLAQNFASITPPVNPFQGQLWLDLGTGLLKIMQTVNGTWSVVNSQYFSNTYRHVQSTLASTWTVSHGLNLPSPFIGTVQFYVNTPNGIKIIIPSDVTFVDANNLTVTFTNQQTGLVLVHS